jgi:hypothetical protein
MRWGMGIAINDCGSRRQGKGVNNIEWAGGRRSGCDSKGEIIGIGDEDLDVKHVMGGGKYRYIYRTCRWLR